MALTFRDLERLFKVKPGRRARLDDYDPGWSGKEETALLKDERKARAQKFVEENVRALGEAQELLYANDVYSVLLVLQAMDAAGKDGTIKHVMSGVNPQGCQVFSFKKPSDEDLDHNFLWRYSRALPERGRIGIFNRSYYEEVLVVRVHPELLQRQRLPPGKRGRSFWADRYHDINEFERHLVRNGTRIVKVFLHISKDEQKKRFLERLQTPEKHWKFSPADLEERAHWDAYQKAFSEMLTHTSTGRAPWWVVPADNKWVARLVVAAILTKEIAALALKPPVVSEAQKAALAAAREALVAEK